MVNGMAAESVPSGRDGAEADFYAQGKHGQIVYVCPSKRAVLVRHGSGNHGPT